MISSYDPTYFWYVFIPTMFLSLGVQIWLGRIFRKWSRVENSADLTGEKLTDALLDQTALEPIPVKHVSGYLTDHYNPGKNSVNLMTICCGSVYSSSA